MKAPPPRRNTLNWGDVRPGDMFLVPLTDTYEELAGKVYMVLRTERNVIGRVVLTVAAPGDSGPAVWIGGPDDEFYDDILVSRCGDDR